MENFISIAIPTLSVILFIFFSILIIRKMNKIGKEIPQINDLKKIIDNQENQASFLSEKEKSVVSKTIIDFYYVRNDNKGIPRIESIFEDYLDRNKITKLTLKEISWADIKNEINTTGKLSTQYKKSIESEKEIKVYEPSLEQKFLYVLIDLIIKEQVYIITDEIEIEFIKTNKFKNALKNIENYISIDSEKIEKQIENLNAEDAKFELEKLEKLDDLVIVQGNALITYEDEAKSITLRLEHPISKYNKIKIEIFARIPNSLYSTHEDGVFKEAANLKEMKNVIIFGKKSKTINITKQEFNIKIDPYIIYA